MNGLEVSLELDLAYESGREPARHAPAVETTIYRLVQEALTNAVKHAQATRVKVGVSETSDWIDIAVSDDGIGFDPDAERRGVRPDRDARARLAGGRDVLGRVAARARHDRPLPDSQSARVAPRGSGAAG